MLLEFKTFRRRGHEEASGTKYVPEDLMSYWEDRDPISRFEKGLEDNYLPKNVLEQTLKDLLNY